MWVSHGAWGGAYTGLAWCVRTEGHLKVVADEDDLGHVFEALDLDLPLVRVLGVGDPEKVLLAPEDGEDGEDEGDEGLAGETNEDLRGGKVRIEGDRVVLSERDLHRRRRCLAWPRRRARSGRTGTARRPCLRALVGN